MGVVAMDGNEGDSGPKIHGRPTSKVGARTFLPGPRLSISLSLMQKQLTQLDRLAVEIRAFGGIWITRSGIITAFIEAASRSEAVAELQDGNESGADDPPTGSG